MTVGPMEGTVEAIAQSNHEIAGFIQTRLTVAVAEGDPILPVESTDGMPATGSVLVFGTIYTYQALSPTTIEGIAYSDGVTSFPGAIQDLRAETIVTDVSKNFNAMDQLRRAITVDFATGEDLSTVGRNLGVLRLRLLSDDDIFRELVKAIAYSPKGTIYSLELALDALLGSGNYRIFEDLIREPNKVFVELLGTAAANTESQGKTFVDETELRLAGSGTTVSIGNNVVDRGKVERVLFRDEDRFDAFLLIRPSSIVEPEYEGGPNATIWTYQGTATEATYVTPGTYAVTLTDPTNADTVYYQHDLHADSGTDLVYAIRMQTTALPAIGLSDLFRLRVSDGARIISVGMSKSGSITNFGFVADGAGTFLGSQQTVGLNTWVEVKIVVRRDTGNAELYLDDVLIDTQAITAFDADGSTDPRAEWGLLSTGTTGTTIDVKWVSLWAKNTVDYWSEYGAATAANPNQLTATSGAFVVTTDIGKSIRTYGGTTANPDGGDNNGRWEILTTGSTTVVTVQGRDQEDAQCPGASAPTRIIANRRGQLFNYPSDLGKEIEIFGSGVGNDGTFTIKKIFTETSPGTYVDLSTLASTIDVVGVAVEVDLGAHADLEEETEVAWRMHPNFVAEAGLSWQMNDSGSVSGTSLTLRTSLPWVNPRILAIQYAQVLSAQVLLSNDKTNVVTQPSPLEFAYYPVYLNDPLGVVRTILDDLTAAGVIPEALIL